MATIDKSPLDARATELTENISTENQPIDFVLSAFSADAVTADRMVAVNFVEQLPNHATQYIPPGQIVFVKELGVPVVSGNCRWVGLDGRVLDYTELYELWTWGENSNGQLGIDSTVDMSSPVRVSGGFVTWSQVNSGFNHIAAIKTDGTLWTWGCNNCGQLGDYTTVSRSSPGTTAGGGTNWCQVSAGSLHTAATKTDGTLWTWGLNTDGILGSGDIINRSSPGTTAGGGIDWCQVSSGCRHTAAIKTDGTLWTWGDAANGRLGDGTNSDRSSPGTTAGGGTDWCQVNAGTASTAAVKTDGTLWTWGNNTSGRLGDGTTVDKTSPVTTAGGGTDWCNVSTGYASPVAIKTDGTIWTWGRNLCGSLGDNSILDRSSPGTTAGGGTTWCQVSSGCPHLAALKTDGTLWTWGRNLSGTLGDNSAIDRSSPGTTVGGITTWLQVSAGQCHVAAIAIGASFR